MHNKFKTDDVVVYNNKFAYFIHMDFLLDN